MVVELANIRHEMAQNPPQLIDKSPTLSGEEKPYLAFRNDNVRFLAANRPALKPLNKNG